MKKIYHLASCDTCKKTIKSIDNIFDYQLQEIKLDPISPEELDYLKSLAGSYEKLFSKRAQLYKERNLKEANLTEDDYRSLILEHYTFLNRPIKVEDDKIFIRKF